MRQACRMDAGLPGHCWHDKELAMIRKAGKVMEFTEFVSAILREVKERLGDGYDVGLQKIPVNNGKVLTGLSIRRRQGYQASTVKLDPYFAGLETGITVRDAADDIIRIYYECETAEVDMEDVLDFNRIKGKVTCRLVNTSTNREWLESIPHIEWLDLSIIFYLILGRSEKGQMAALVSQEQMEAWGVTAEELRRIAYENMEHLFPVQIMTMEDVMKDILKRELGISIEEGADEGQKGSPRTGIPLYVLTNSVGFAGACYMIPGMGIERLAEQLGKDLVVLPSSIHEVLATPYEDGMDLAGLSRLVQGINRAEVPREDRLSDRVYYFDRERGMLMVGDDGEIVR